VNLEIPLMFTKIIKIFVVVTDGFNGEKTSTGVAFCRGHYG